ncbi:FAD binding domain-containing protein [Methylocella sp.]|uniref:FAD binding domain-containing protein n=1 Tax=Methylocella sp. TaxID=1978226 RepID=UPI003783B82F
MNRFSYLRAETVAEAARAVAGDAGAAFIAGGTNLVDLMKYDVARPSLLVDISRLPLRGIEETAAGGLRVGALVDNAALARDARVEAGYPLLASALLAGASAQLRNAATVGGNLNQRTRCYYFYDVATPCNKREPGSGCPALEGLNRIHAILGASEQCVATNPSDMCVALAALDAVVHVEGEGGARAIPIGEFHRLPGGDPSRDVTLRRGEMVVAVELPPPRFGARHSYLKLRDRLSYAFALVSVAAALEIDENLVKTARVALGGVAHKPWRDPSAEALMEGEAPSPDLFARVAGHLLRDARGLKHNSFKIELARRAIVRALSQAAAGAPQSQNAKSVN